MSTELPFQNHKVPACSCIFCTALSVLVNHLPASLIYVPLHSHHISETVFRSETLEDLLQSSRPLSAVINRNKTNYSPHLWYKTRVVDLKCRKEDSGKILGKDSF